MGVSLVVERTACVRADSQHKFVDSVKNFWSLVCKYAIIFSFVEQIHKFGQDWWSGGYKQFQTLERQEACSTTNPYLN